MLRPLLAVLALCAAGPALAQKKLAVIEVGAPPSMLGLSNQITQMVLSAASEQGYSVTPPEQLRKTLGDKAYKELMLCVGKPACVQGRLGGLKLDRAVVGALGRDERNYLLKLQLVDLRKGEIIADVDRSILIASRRLVQDASAAVPPLLRGEREARGTLKLSSNVPNAEVTLDGEKLTGTTPITTQLKPGKHEVKLSKPHYLPVTRWVTVEANQVTQEEVRLILEPNQEPEDAVPFSAPLATTSATPAARESGRGLRVPTAAWVALGTGVAAVGVGAIFGASARHDEQVLKDGYDPDRDLYAGTREAALAGRQKALVANVLYGVAGAAAVTAVVLTVVKTLQGGPSVSAAVTPEGGAVFVRGSF